MPSVRLKSGRGAWLKSSAALCLLLPAFLLPRADEAGPVPVRFAEGTIHGFLVLSTTNGNAIASGDLRQIMARKGIESRTIFHFKDGSLSEETVVFTQQKVLSMQSYELVQRGPAFASDTEISLDRGSGKYRVRSRNHKDGREKVIDGALEFPPDVYNGMIFTVLRNLPGATSKTIHVIAFTPEPQLIQLQMIPEETQKVKIDGSSKPATHYVLHPQLGTWLKLFTKLTGHMPPDEHVWMLADSVPAFVKFEGPLYIGGPVWRIELTSPKSG